MADQIGKATPGKSYQQWQVLRAGWSVWTREDRREAYRRKDGAVVLYDDRSPHPNPLSKGCKMWTAWEPDPSTDALRMRRSGSSAFTFPRRWSTASRAMKAVDREFPIGKGLTP